MQMEALSSSTREDGTSFAAQLAASEAGRARRRLPSRRRGSPRVEDPRGLKLAWKTMTPAQLAGLLGDARPAVRERAIQALACQGDAAVAALNAAVHDRASSAETRRNAVWTACRIEHPASLAVIITALGDADESVRQAAIHSVSVRRAGDAVSSLTTLLHGSSLQNRRAAAEALGRIGDRSAVPEILKAVGEISGPDRALQHSLTYALIEIGDPAGTAKGLAETNLRKKRAALVALDEMDGAGVDPLGVAALLDSADSNLKEAASWIIGRHPEWAKALAGFLRDRLMKEGLAAAASADLEKQLTRFAKATEIQELLAERLADPSASNPVKLLALRAMAQSGIKDTPASWIGQLARILGEEKNELIPQAVATTRLLAPNPQKAAVLVPRLDRHRHASRCPGRPATGGALRGPRRLEPC